MNALVQEGCEVDGEASLLGIVKNLLSNYHQSIKDGFPGDLAMFDFVLAVEGALGMPLP